MTSRRFTIGTKARAASLGLSAVLVLGAGSVLAAPQLFPTGFASVPDLVRHAIDTFAGPSTPEPSETPDATEPISTLPAPRAEPTDAPPAINAVEPTETPEASEAPDATETPSSWGAAPEPSDNPSACRSGRDGGDGADTANVTGDPQASDAPDATDSAAPGDGTPTLPPADPAACAKPSETPDATHEPDGTHAPDATDHPDAIQSPDQGGDNHGTQAEPTHTPEPTDAPQQGGDGGDSGGDGGSGTGD